MIRKYLLITCVVLIAFMSACSDDEFNILRNEVNSPENNYTASISDYTLSAVAPLGQKVYVSNADGANKSEVFFAYGYSCDIEWTNETTLKIIAQKVYNMNVYLIKTMKEKWGDVEIIYEKVVSDGFRPGEPWEPKK